VIEGVSPDLPYTDRLPASKEWVFRLARPLVRVGLRLGWRVRVHGAQQVPSSGPVILAANHIGLLDGPALVALTKRLTFAMVKREAFTGPVGQFLIHIGQISLNRREIDPQAIRRAVQVLRAGKVLAVFPEGGRGAGKVAWAKGGAAYLAMVSGAPIVPVAILGTREPGQRKSQVPHLRRPIHVVYGEPFTVPRSSWPRRKAAVAKWTEVIRERLADHVIAAQALTGLPLPGPPKIKSALSTV
jgi:1-acyl-sn-glycerol-3-phosphate acyltransferase